MGEMSRKVHQERRLQWYGHLMRRQQDYVGRKAREEERRWWRCEGLVEKGLPGEEVHDRVAAWR